MSSTNVAKHGGPAPRLSGALVSWGLVSLIPMAAYAMPLWQNALADTPLAYLIWIPLLAVGWAGWNLATLSTPYPDDQELNVLLGVGLTALVGAILALAPMRWAASMVYGQAGLLLWPLWALGLAWILFGIGVTRRIALPLLYWGLAWPPLFSAIADATQGFLVGWASDAVKLLSRTTSWVHAGSLPGTFFVDHAGHSVEVVVAQACSGADSLLGAAILLPLLLTIWKGPAVRRAVLAALALAGALVLNWLRLLILVAAVHFLGGNVTFEVIHPFLGFALFALLGLILSALTRPLGLHPPAVPKSALVLPGKKRLFVAGAFAAGLFTMLWPLFATPLGNAGNPLSVPYTELSRLIPPLPGFARSVAYEADESSILGPHSATLAFLYRTASGANALAEVWSTPNTAALASYGFRDCLLYHGDQIVATQSFALPSGLPAVAYAVAMAPTTVGGTRPIYVDVEWNSVVKTPEGLRYLRWSVAAFPQSPGLWPPSIRLASAAHALSGLQGLSVPPSEGKWPAYLEATKTLLQQFSGSLYASLTSGGRSETLADG